MNHKPACRNLPTSRGGIRTPSERGGLVRGIGGMGLLFVAWMLGLGAVVRGGEAGTNPEPVATVPTLASDPDAWPVPAGWKKLTPQDAVWVNVHKKQVMVGGRICLTQGVLEMFACPKQTKEHESIVAVDCQAQVVHAALLAVGAEAGHPVRYQPTYMPATGTSVDIQVIWLNDQGKPEQRLAREMIRHVKSGKMLDQKWVFAGSLFWEDPATKRRYYQAEGGEFVCVSNFGTAMLDLPISSSDSANDLLFDAMTEKIPPRDTPVRLIFISELSEKQGQSKAAPNPLPGHRGSPTNGPR